MSTVLEPVQTLRYSSHPGQNVCEETTTSEPYEGPITPPITPSSITASSTQCLRLASSLVIAELLSEKLRAPTHYPLTRQQDIGNTRPVEPSFTPVELISNTSSPSPLLEGIAVDVPTAKPRSLHLGTIIRDSAKATQTRDSLQSKKEISQYLADNTQVQLSDSTAAPSNQEASSVAVVDHQQKPRTPSNQIASGVILTIDIASPEIYQRDKNFYVGKMRDLHCPPEVETEWTRSIRPRLIKDLLPVLQSLPRSMASKETMIEPDLCMAGYAPGKATEVQLSPTVWIRCGSKKCRKVIRQAVNDLNYLHSFSRGTVEVRVRGPRPAASSNNIVPTRNPVEGRNCLVNGEMKLQVQASVTGASACGLRLRVIHGDASGMDDANILTIGGLVKVDNMIYGLSSAHGILDSSRVARKISSPTSQSSEPAPPSECSDSDSESEDDSDTSFNSNRFSELVPTIKRQYREYDDLGQTAKTNFQKQTKQLQWKDVPFCGPISYCGQGSVTGGTSAEKSALQDADFALINMGFSSAYRLYNQYKPEGITGLPPVSIRGVKHDEHLQAGEVLLLTGHNHITRGYLLEEPSLFINRGIVFNTRKIQLDAPLPTGTSGTWVVQDSLLCGIITAIYDGDPYAHMITADKMFQDIRDFQPSLFVSREVDVATEDDINTAYAKMKMSRIPSLESFNISDLITESAATSQGLFSNEYSLAHIGAHLVSANENITTAITPPIANPYVSSYNHYNHFDAIPAEQERRRLETKAWILVKISYRFLRPLRFLIILPFIPVYGTWKFASQRLSRIEHWRHLEVFKLPIRVFYLMLFVLSCATVGLTTYNSITVLGREVFLFWQLPYTISILILFSLFQWLLRRLQRVPLARSGYDDFVYHDPLMSMLTSSEV